MNETFEIAILRAAAGTGSWYTVERRFSDLDTEEALARAYREGLRGPLAHGLVDARVEDAEVRSAVHEEVLWNAQYLALLRTLDDVLTDLGREAVVLKGAALMPTVYQGRLGMRFLSDIDLFLDATTLEALAERLAEMGFVRRQDEPTFSKDGLTLDLHLEVTGRVEGAFAFGGEALRQESRPLADYRALRTLNPEDLWLQLAVHATKHAFRRWLWLLDLALVWPQVTPGKLQEKALELRAQRAVTYATRLLQEVVGLETLPDMVVLNPVENKFLAQVRARQASESFGKFIPLFSIPGVSGKLRYLYRFLRPQHPGQTQFGRLRQLFMLLKGWLPGRGGS